MSPYPEIAVRLSTACALVPALLCASLGSARARVDVPDECGSESELRSELARLLGDAAAADALPEALQIERAGNGDYVLTLELRDATRTLRDPDCRTLFKAAVIVAAAAVDPSVSEQNVRAQASAAPQADDAAPRVAEDDADTAARASWHVGAAIGAGATFALLPGPSPMLELSASLAHGDVGLELATRYLGAAEERVGDAYGVRVNGIGGQLSAFYDPLPFARLQFGAVVDRLSGRGLGSAVAGVSGSGLVAALALEAFAVPLRVGRARLSLGAGAHYALVRPSFEITGYGVVHRVPVLGVSGIARLGWQFR